MANCRLLEQGAKSKEALTALRPLPFALSFLNRQSLEPPIGFEPIPGSFEANRSSS